MQYADVSCAPGSCDVKAKSVTRHSDSSGVKEPAQQNLGGHAELGGEGTPPSPADDAAPGWGHSLATLGLVNAGKGMLPRADGGAPDDPEADAQQGVPAKVAAQQAVARLKLPQPVIHTSPREDVGQVVHVPTWMWVERRTWGPVAASAAVGGVEVTATVRPQRVVWSMGEGGTVVCRGPGTPYSNRFSPKASSPDCGYTYQRASTSVSGKAFPVRAQVFWDVEWEGGGRSGVVPGLMMSVERRLVVGEVQAVVTH
ncbi:hypothetical protein [Streptomyces sp. NPDC093707]|uniref:hypothetical protein n=1 Tax=Streptomyces sp. NPDC093707 TaxID=3154984 RepID=UPI00344F5B61